MTAAASPAFSWSRAFAVFFKELVQMRRDRLTFAMMVMMPVIQLLLFGYAINNDPRHMPAVVEMREDGPLTRAFLASLAQAAAARPSGAAALANACFKPKRKTWDAVFLL